MPRYQFCDCEDFPCCGCDADGDPRTDEEIKQDVYDRMALDDFDPDYDDEDELTWM